MGLEVPRLDQRLRIHSTSLSNDMQRQLTRRTGWTLTWDVKRSLIEVQEGEGRETWIEQVGELSRNVREIIAAGGLEAWVKAEIGKAAAANTKVTKCVYLAKGTSKYGRECSQHLRVCNDTRGAP